MEEAINGADKIINRKNSEARGQRFGVWKVKDMADMVLWTFCDPEVKTFNQPWPKQCQGEFFTEYKACKWVQESGIIQNSRCDASACHSATAVTTVPNLSFCRSASRD